MHRTRFRRAASGPIQRCVQLQNIFRNDVGFSLSFSSNVICDRRSPCGLIFARGGHSGYRGQYTYRVTPLGWGVDATAGIPGVTPTELKLVSIGGSLEVIFRVCSADPTNAPPVSIWEQ